MNNEEPRHFYCKDCGNKSFGRNKAVKHEDKTGHTTAVNWLAENAHMKHKARQAYASSYIGRLEAKTDQERNGFSSE